jgi:hypothetical protein
MFRECKQCLFELWTGNAGPKSGAAAPLVASKESPLIGGNGGAARFGAGAAVVMSTETFPSPARAVPDRPKRRRSEQYSMTSAALRSKRSRRR